MSIKPPTDLPALALIDCMPPRTCTHHTTKDALRKDGPGKAEVKLQALIDGNEVKIGVPGRFRLSGELRQQLQRMPGILSVREL